jgi:hypothetical protein
MRFGPKVTARQIAEEVILPKPDPDRMELYVLRAIARLDDAASAYSHNKHIPQRVLVDALLDVRSVLKRALDERVQVDGPVSRPYIEAES